MPEMLKGLEASKLRAFVIIAGIVGFLILFGSLFFAWGILEIVGIKGDLLQTFPDIILKYMFIVAAVERSAAVFVGMLRNQGRVDWGLRISRIDKVLNDADATPQMIMRVFLRERMIIDRLVEKEIILPINLWDGDEKIDTLEEFRAYLMSARQAYEFQSARYESVSSKQVSRIVFIAGLVLAACGLSIFSDIVVMDGVSAAYQIFALRLSDIVITGGLLGGGSAGLNAISNRLGQKING